jgi:hypothetical protein
MNTDRSSTSPPTIAALLVPSGPAAEQSRALDVEPVRRRVIGRRWVLPVAYAVGAVMLVAAVVVGVNAHAELNRARSSVSSTRAELRHAQGLVVEAKAGLTKYGGQADAARRALASTSAQLSADQAKLAADQVDVFSKGVSISQLDTCLSGVEQALNQISLGDPTGAATTLNGVAANCRAAEPSGT